MSEYVMHGLMMEGETTQASEKGNVNRGDEGTEKTKGIGKSQKVSPGIRTKTKAARSSSTA
jgi:hypothetical protein